MEHPGEIRPTVTYEVASLSDARERGWPYFYAWDAAGDITFGWGVWRCEDGVGVEIIGEDGGEPEDQILVRDWSWVAPAIQAAFDLGVSHSGREAQP